jgi:polygalacturonase
VLFLRIPPLKGDFITDYMEIPFDKYIDYELDLSNGQIYDIRDYGAKGNGRFLNTHAIQDTITNCYNNGGGTVLISGGDYLSGEIRLMSNITLRIAPDSRLIASTDPKNYPSSNFIYTLPQDNAENITITGAGTIFGNGEYFWNPPKSKALESAPDNWDVDRFIYEHYKVKRYGRNERPHQVVMLRNVTNLNIENIVFENMWGWTVYAEGCNNVIARNIVINNNLFGENTDGIAFTNCQNVLLEKSFITTGDDAVCYKADRLTDGTTNQKLLNHVFRDLELCSMTNGIKFGTTSYNDLGMMVIDNIKMFNPTGWPGTISGIAIEAVDGAIVDGFSISNISMDNVACPIFIRLGNRNRFELKDYTGEIHNINISNVTATNVELPITISGVKEADREPRYITSVHLENIDIYYNNSNYNPKIPDTIPEVPKEYPEAWNFGDLPAYGVYARYVENLTIINLQVTTREIEDREKYYFYYVSDYVIE